MIRVADEAFVGLFSLLRRLLSILLGADMAVVDLLAVRRALRTQRIPWPWPRVTRGGRDCAVGILCRHGRVVGRCCRGCLMAGAFDAFDADSDSGTRRAGTLCCRLP